MTPDAALAYLQAFPDWERGTVGADETYTLDRMRRLLEVLEHPDRAFGIVHVVGTKGKGSTAAMIAAGLRAGGYRTGLFISPHLVDYRERVRVDGRLIAPDALAAIVLERLQPALERLRRDGDKPPLHFEMLCALALEHFRRCAVDVAVVEAGLGGRLDATNAVSDPALTVITTIGRDHMAVLGETVSAIAAEKAAVIRPRGRVVSSAQPPEALSVIETVCREREATLDVVGRDWVVRDVESRLEGTTFDLHGRDSALEQVRVPLAGAHQAANAATAVAALAVLRPRYPALDESSVRAGLARTRWPGRLQVAARQPLVLLDAAHNEDSAVALASALPALPVGRPLALVVALLRDKDAEAVLAPLLPLADHVIVTEAEHPRALATAALAAATASLGVAAESASSIAAALERARVLARPDGCVVVTGSLRTVGEAMAALGLNDDDR